jgi:hypothetical protein
LISGKPSIGYKGNISIAISNIERITKWFLLE